jgi:chromosome segregation ATPase
MAFRIRSSARDEKSDADRLASIERALQRAIADAEAEKTGLARRFQSAKDRASMLIGNDATEYLDRDPETERLLTEAERELLAAEARMRQLSAHVNHLRGMLHTLKDNGALSL